MNNLTDFPKTVETSLDPRLYQVAIFRGVQNTAALHSFPRRFNSRRNF